MSVFYVDMSEFVPVLRKPNQNVKLFIWKTFYGIKQCRSLNFLQIVKFRNN